jgi:hypothetical protein
MTASYARLEILPLESTGPYDSRCEVSRATARGVMNVLLLEEDVKVARHGLTHGRLAADTGGDAADDDGIDAARAEDQLEVGALEGAVSGFEQKYSTSTSSSSMPSIITRRASRPHSRKPSLR